MSKIPRRKGGLRVIKQNTQFAVQIKKTVTHVNWNVRLCVLKLEVLYILVREDCG